MTEEKEICKICGNSYKNLGSHVRSGHNISMEEYEVYKVPPEADTSESDDALENIQDGIDVTEIINKTTSELSDILEEYNISKQELIIILENRKNKTKVPIALTPENIAKKLSTEKSPSTQDLKVAEILVTIYGFKIVGGGPTTKGGKIPKTWFMSK